MTFTTCGFCGSRSAYTSTSTVTELLPTLLQSYAGYPDSIIGLIVGYLGGSDFIAVMTPTWARP